MYLALAKLRECSAKKVSEFSKVARPDIYRVLRELQALDLVERKIGRPEGFIATPMEKGISILYEKRLNEMQELQEKTGKLVKKFTDTARDLTTELGDFKFIETTERGATLPEILARKKNKRWLTLDIASSWNRTARWVVICRRYILETLNRGVRIRLIVEKPDRPSEGSLKNLNALRKDPRFVVRFLTTEPPAHLSIQDNEEVDLILNPTPFGVGGFGRCLFSNHLGFVGLARTYFDSIWTMAEEGVGELKSPDKIGAAALQRPRKQKILTRH